MFHNNARAAAKAGSFARSSRSRHQFNRKKYSSIPNRTAPAQCPMVFTSTGSWMLSQSGILVLTISDFGGQEWLSLFLGRRLMVERTFIWEFLLAPGGRDAKKGCVFIYMKTCPL